MESVILSLHTKQYNELEQARQEYDSARLDLHEFKSTVSMADPKAVEKYRFLVERKHAARLRYYEVL